MDAHIPPYIFCLLLKKNWKSKRAWPILKSNTTSFWFKIFFLRWTIHILRKGGPAPIYEVSIVVIIDSTAILLTPGIFLIQIVNTNNTNMYLIHFHSKNIIKMCFPKSLVFKVQNRFRHSLSIGTRWNKVRWHQQRLLNTGLKPDLKKK